MTPAISLPVVQRPTAPADRFRCEHWSCVLTAASCIARQNTRGRWVGESHGKRFRKQFVPLRLKYCASGQCEQGKAIAAALMPRREEPAA